MQQFIKYFMNMRLLARRAEYARGAASGADGSALFARRNSGISGALESRRHAQFFWALLCGDHLQGELQRARPMENREAEGPRLWAIYCP